MSDTRWRDFWGREFVCADGCGRGVEDMAPDFMDRLQRLRTETGVRMSGTSGYRCPAHNLDVSKTGRVGPHTTGHAFDFVVRSLADAFRVVAAAPRLGFTCIGVIGRDRTGRVWLHLDDLPDTPARPRPVLVPYNYLG